MAALPPDVQHKSRKNTVKISGQGKPGKLSNTAFPACSDKARAGAYESLPGLFPVRICPDAYLYGKSVLFLPFFKSRGSEGFIRRKPRDPFFQYGDFCRITPCDIRFQTVFLACILRFQQLQLAHLNIQLHLLFDMYIARGKGLDLRIGKGGIVHVLTGAHRGFAGHDLADKFLFVLQNLPHICVKC